MRPTWSRLVSPLIRTSPRTALSHPHQSRIRACSSQGASRQAIMDEVGAWGAWQVEPATFTALVASSMRKLYPEDLADKAWDNVGLLLGNCETDSKKRKPVVLVTNDLTFQVAVDAIGQGASVIVSYHPIIFSGLKSVTNADPQQATLIHLAKAGVAVYCPHTAVDAAPEGLNTWLADIVAGTVPHERSVAIPCSKPPAEITTPVGYGAIGRFRNGETVALTAILQRLAQRLGGLRHVMVATPVGATVASTHVRSFGVCAGSGYDVLKGADVDLLVTGETSHHSALRAIQQGRTLVQVFHSNSERGYLREVLRPKLQAELRRSVPEAEVVVSEYDRDPFSVVDVSEL